MHARKPIVTIALVTVLVILSSCMHPPKYVPPRPEADVAASFGRTWDAALAAFAERKINVTTDRNGGMIMSIGLSVADNDTNWTSCGEAGVNARVMKPEIVRYTVMVKGDSTKSTMKATAIFGSDAGLLVAQCPSKGSWESEFEADVRRRVAQP
jgi:hypothetical protein